MSAPRVSLPKEAFDLLILAMKQNTVVLQKVADAVKNGEAKESLKRSVILNTLLIQKVESAVSDVAEGSA
jgi:hypothetical protein